MTVTEYLKSLGNSEAEVAESLRQQGVKGLRKNTCNCPVLNGIYKACPDYWPGLRIFGGKKYGDHWIYQALLGDAQILDPTLPQAVMDFIGEFDEGKYPDLEAKSVKTVKVTTWE
jgi:hypothetical protein